MEKVGDVQGWLDQRFGFPFGDCGVYIRPEVVRERRVLERLVVVIIGMWSCLE